MKCKIVPVTESMLKMYVGGSFDNMFKERVVESADAQVTPA